MTSLSILLVDDDENLVRVLRRILVRGGHDVTTSTTSTAALVELDRRSIPFDLLITDFNLGSTTCHALLDETRRRSPSTRLMVLTADLALRFVAGDVEVRSKPIGAQPLLEAILATTGAR